MGIEWTGAGRRPLMVATHCEDRPASCLTDSLDSHDHRIYDLINQKKIMKSPPAHQGP
jgi:hypothetical protein